MTRRDKIERMLQDEPNDAFLHFGLAMELVKEGMTDKAITQFERVLAIDPLYTAAHHHLGNALIAAGRVEAARGVLSTGVDAARQIGNAHAEGEMLALLEGLSGSAVEPRSR